jgi:hypothetical protein
VEQDGSSRRKCVFLFNAASGRIKQATTSGGSILTGEAILIPFK